MKRSVELLRWSLVLLFGGMALWPLAMAGVELVSSELDIASVFVSLLFVLILAGVPAAFAYFAYARRWRDLVAVPIVIFTVIAWYQFMMLPTWLWQLEPLIPRKPGDPRWLDGIVVAAHLLCLLFSFRVSDWVYRRLERLAVRYIPPDPSTNTVIEQAG